MRKRSVKALLSILLTALFLFNTLTVTAAETAVSWAVTESVIDSGQPGLPDKPEQKKIPRDLPLGDSEGDAEPPEDSASEESSFVWVEVDTFEELYEALESSTSRETTRIRLMRNITVPAIEEYISALDHPIELDLDSYTLYVEGLLQLQSGLMLTGSAGEDALIRVRTGGLLHIHDVEIQAGDRFAVWQEEGAAFTFTPMPDFSGKIHFAEKDVAMPHSFLSWKVAMPVAVVHDGQSLADVLPDTDSVYLYRNDGTGEPAADIAVDWEVDAYQAELDTRTRTVITGSYPDANTLHQPICLVVFQNGNPAIFLDAYGMESYGWPRAKVKIELLEPELGCRFEWSQDGETWLPADAVETPSSDGRLAFTVSFPQETPPAYPYYLSAVVDYPDGSTGYSDVLVIEKAYSQCDSGGNRHGGTGVAPPELPPIADGGNDKEDDKDGADTPSVKPNPPEEDGADTSPPLDVNPPDDEDDAKPSTETPEEPPQSLPPSGNSILKSPVPTATEAWNLPPTLPSAQQKADEPTLSQETPVSSSPALQAMASEENEHKRMNSAAFPAKTAAQTAVGVIATGGIIVLTMTWASWSKRLVGLLRKLLKR